MRKAALVSIFAISVSLPGATSRSQEPGGFGGVQSLGFSSTYSPNSSHILLGDAEQRRVWTLGVEYKRLLHQGPRFRFEYEGSVMPLWEETDPTLIGTTFTLNGQAVVISEPSQRVVKLDYAPIGAVTVGAALPVPVYAMFGRQDSHAAAISPLGARVSALPRWRIQPTFALDLGFVVSPEALPVDESAQFNYTFALGPGIEFFSDHKTSWRVEYLYRHMSNAGQGFQNPGLDQAVFRVTVSGHR